ncbi:pyridine nucleotide-disulfide oxidoreductase [Acidihalobacter aeolianus]|uniref:Pyridine nucleotide-disulfide oxidoreductase n=1 Tax=Acidihalobacter aeolianus TaxID=2792603 RepID=A0A1D8K7R0_9GAMM|nr:pyridine nucleotide-disulfide oxidoreductase [Acidihalobacter aeolianus]AOV17005.1 pyridine nucleotide-disulfide oxidoreductase [Acidihalobacter aeolianus]
MKKKVVIAGNGFASLFFIMYFLASPVFPFFAWFIRRIHSRYDITVIGNGVFVYSPAIPGFLTGKRNKAGITVDIRPFLQRRNIRFVEGQVTDVRDDGRTVITDRGTYTNDVLFLGTGPSFRKDDIPGTEEHTYSPCYGPDDMERFMAKLATLDGGIVYVGFKINKTDGFVAGRTGPMYECVCLLDYALRKRGVRDQFEIHFFSPNRNPGEKGVLTDRLREREIILDDGYAPVEFVEGGMVNPDGTFRKADLVLYSPEMTGPKFAKQSCLPISVGGHLDVDRYGQARGLHNVFAAGDCASHETPPPWVPHQAHMAQLRAKAAARNTKAVLAGKGATNRYRHELSCILDMENDALWMHVSEDGKPPFWNIFPRRSKILIRVKGSFERIFLFYLRHL